MKYQNTLSYARSLDEKDDLREYRSYYHFPRHKGKEVIYFTGNSLGLQPKGVKDALLQELDDWAHLGVEGHFHAKNPWFSYHENFSENIASLSGALPGEVVVMNQLTVNLHLLLISFYQPKGKRKKILFETNPFPSDRYAFESHAQLHGLKSEEVLIEMQPREGEAILRTEDIQQKISELGDELALVCFGAVNYYTGQYFDIPSIAEAAHKAGASCGFDLAHTIGNLPLKLHEWNVDFACWCSYKYLNSGPGSVAGVFIHQKHIANKHLLRLAGWWGTEKSTRFNMYPHFQPCETAEGWQLSNAPVLSMAAHKAAIDLFAQAGMERLRKKSVLLTGYLEFILGEVARKTNCSMDTLTPKEPEMRGCQLSIVIKGKNKSLITDLTENGVLADWREPNVLRLAPVPMYNSFEDIHSFGLIFAQLLAAGK